MRRIVLPILLVCTFVTVFGMASLEEYFYRTRPRAPDVAAARVYPENVKSFQGVARVVRHALRETPIRLDRILESDPLRGWHHHHFHSCLSETQTRIIAEIVALSRLTNRSSQPLFGASMSSLISVFSTVAKPRPQSGG